MVCHHKRNTERACSETTMQSVVNMVKNQGYSIQKAASAHDVEHDSLSRYTKKMRLSACNEVMRLQPNYSWRKYLIPKKM